MNNEMKFEKNGLLILNSALEELGLAGISLSAWLGSPSSNCCVPRSRLSSTSRNGLMVSALASA